MSSTPLDRAGPWRFDELAALPDDGRRYEVVDGHLVVTPPPARDHQLASIRLARQLMAACPPEWEIVVEMALPLGTDGRVPDISVMRSIGALTFGQDPYPTGPAGFGLVVEVTSPSSRKTDLFAKPGEYAEAGIPLFWRLDTEPDLQLHAYILRDGSYDADAVVLSVGVVAAPWGPVVIDLDQVRFGPV